MPALTFPNAPDAAQSTGNVIFVRGICHQAPACCACPQPDAQSVIGVVPPGAAPRLYRRPLYPPAEREIVFTRGATEAINLVAHSWGNQLKSGDRILLSVLEHHSNIVPWQLLRDRTGVEIDVCPLTEDGRIDLDAAEKMLTPAHKLVAFAHISNVLGSVLDAKRAAKLAHAVGAKLLLDRGYPDVFISSELTCSFPEDGCNVHVTVANVTEAQFAEARRQYDLGYTAQLDQ
jgi:hypothetical protein